MNSYRNFLLHAIGLGPSAASFLNVLSRDYPSAASVRPMSVDGNDVNLENSLRATIGKSAWPADRVRRLFVAAQPHLPAIYAAAKTAGSSTWPPLRSQAMEPSATPSFGQIAGWGLAHLDLFKEIGSAAMPFYQADSLNERWLILRPIGDKAAPALDELFGTEPAATLSSTDDEIRSQLLAALNASRSEGELSASFTFDPQWISGAIALIQLLREMAKRRKG